MLGILLINAIFSIIFPLGKLAMAYAGPFFTIGVRKVLGGLLLLAFRFIVPDKERHYMTLSFWKSVGLLAIFNVFITNGLEFWGLRYLTSSKTALIYNLAPFFSALFGYCYFGERMTKKKWLGFSLSFIGLLPTFVVQTSSEYKLSHIFMLSSAEIALLIATISLTYGWIIMQDVVRNKKYDAVLANGLSMVIGGTIAFIPSFTMHEMVPLANQWHPFLQWVVIMAVLSSCICYPLYSYLLTKYTATFMTFTGLLGPLMAAVFDWMFFGQTVGWEFYCATFFMSIGLYMFYQEELRQGYLIQ